MTNYPKIITISIIHNIYMINEDILWKMLILIISLIMTVIIF